MAAATGPSTGHCKLLVPGQEQGSQHGGHDTAENDLIMREEDVLVNTTNGRRCGPSVPGASACALVLVLEHCDQSAAFCARRRGGPTFHRGLHRMRSNSCQRFQSRSRPHVVSYTSMRFARVHAVPRAVASVCCKGTMAKWQYGNEHRSTSHAPHLVKVSLLKFFSAGRMCVRLAKSFARHLVLPSRQSLRGKARMITGATVTYAFRRPFQSTPARSRALLGHRGDISLSADVYRGIPHAWQAPFNCVVVFASWCICHAI